MARKTITVVWLIALALASFRLADAQQQKEVPRIGYLAGGDPNFSAFQVEGFRRGLRDLGYLEGESIQVEYRYAEGKQDRIPSLVTELVELKVDVLLLTTLPAIRAAKQATKTIPIVIVTAQDPVATGIVDSLAHPGGNITGLTRLTRELSGKRLELLTEVVPALLHVGVLWDAEAQSADIGFKEYEAAARTLKIGLQSLGVRKPQPDFAGAFRAAINGRLNALVIVRTPLITSNQKQIADLGIKNRLPSMNETSDFVESG